MLRKPTGKKPRRANPLYRDGPLSYRPPEVITYATGRCVLGALLVATSEDGIVAIMVRPKVAELLVEFPSSFPKANLVRDEKGSKALLAQVAAYIAAPFEPFALPLDLRGTGFQQSVWNAVRTIPFGQTSTYSMIAEAIGAPKAVRAVASSCTHCCFAFAVPCHRVVSKGGAKPGAQAGRRYRWLAYEVELYNNRPGSIATRNAR